MFYIGYDDTESDIELGLKATSSLIQLLSQQHWKTNVRRVFPSLGIDKLPDWYREDEDRYEPYENDAHRMRYVSKALALELLTANFLSHHDNPIETRCHCLINDNSTGIWEDRPISFAPLGEPDASMLFDDFAMIAEVSTKRNPTLENYVGQLDSALSHAKNIQEESEFDQVFCLLVNERSLSEQDTKKAYDQFLANNRDKATDIHFISASIAEFGFLGTQLDEDALYDLEQSEFKGLLEGMHDLTTQSENALDENWFIKAWSDFVDNPPNPDPEPYQGMSMGM